MRQAPPALILEQLDGILERFVIEEYHVRPHSQTGQPQVSRRRLPVGPGRGAR